jgi:putative membrane protein
MWGYSSDMMGSGWGWLIGALLIVLIALAVIFVFRVAPRHANGFSGEGSGGPGQSPRQILDERYARGDITTEEFRERLKNLGSA